MKKYLILTIISILVLSGCTVQENANNQQKTAELPNMSFEHEDFTLTLPSLYKESDSYLTPKEADAFPEIRYSSYENKEKVKLNQLLEKQKEGFKNLCTQTESCPEVIKSEDLIIENVGGVYILTVDTAPPIGDDSKKQFGHRYLFAMPDKIISFTAYEYAEEERSEEFEKEVSEIINTVKFK